MNDHVPAAVVLFVLTSFVITIFSFKNVIGNIQMMIHNLTLSNPF